MHIIPIPFGYSVMEDGSFTHLLQMSFKEFQISNGLLVGDTEDSIVVTPPNNGQVTIVFLIEIEIHSNHRGDHQTNIISS